HDVLFAEIAVLRKKMRTPMGGELRSAGLADTPKHYLAIANPKTGEGFSGQHGPRTMFIFDEPSAVSEELYENDRKQAQMIIAHAITRSPGGWFRRAFPLDAPDENRAVATSFGNGRCITVGGSICANVRRQRLEKPIAPAGGITIAG